MNMTPTQMIVAAQQYQAPQGLLQMPKLGLLPAPDMGKAYADMSLSDEEVRKIAEQAGIEIGDKITPEVRMQVAAHRIAKIPGNVMSIPGNIVGAGGNIMDAGRAIGTGLLNLFR
jgi:hypothetical protein